jgi:hypothetical protein
MRIHHRLRRVLSALSIALTSAVLGVGTALLSANFAGHVALLDWLLNASGINPEDYELLVSIAVFYGTLIVSSVGYVWILRRYLLRRMPADGRVQLGSLMPIARTPSGLP